MAVYIFDKSGKPRRIKRFYRADADGVTGEISEDEHIRSALTRARERQRRFRYIAILFAAAALGRLALVLYHG